jgi:transketolase
MDKKSTREGFGDEIVELGEDNRVIALTADLGSSLKLNSFKKKFSERYFNVGVAEQNMASLSAGLALEGLIPFMTSFAAFSPYRNFDQIRTSIAYSNANVKICSSHAGLSVGEDGATHQALEDISMMRTLPNMVVLVPADYEEARRIVREAYNYEGPVYIRLGREKFPVITKNRKFKIGKADVLRKGKDITIIACGIMVGKALDAAELLEKEGIDVEVINSPSIKPFDSETLLKSIRKTGYLVSCEEHQIFGGLGSVVSEVLVKNYPIPMEFIGVNDSFGESGSSEEVLKKYGLTVEHIVKTVLKLKS